MMIGISGIALAMASAQDHTASSGARTQSVVTVAPQASGSARVETPAPAPAAKGLRLDEPLAAHLSFDIAPDRSVSNCALDVAGEPDGPPPLCPAFAKIPAPLLDYLRADAKGPVTIAADFTLGLEGGAPLPPHAPRPGVVTFAHLNFDAQPNPAGGRPHCVIDAIWGEYKARLEFPCPREMESAFAGKTQPFHMVMALGSSGPAPDPEGLVPIINMLRKEHSETPGEAEGAAPGAGAAPSPPPAPRSGS